MKHRPRYLIAGASRGIGAAVAEHFASRDADLLLVSRSQPPLPGARAQWVEADLAQPAGIAAVVRAIGEHPLDALLYTGGTWERGAFTSDYDFARSDYAETLKVLAVNLIAPIELMRAAAANLKQAPNPRAVYVGALSGLDNAAGPEVANKASKFGLRGAVQALRLTLAEQGIGLTIIHPGNVATPEVLDDIAENRFPAQTPIPMSDLLATMDYVLSASADCEIREIQLAQRKTE